MSRPRERREEGRDTDQEQRRAGGRGTDEEQQRADTVVVGLLAAPGISFDLAQQVARDLPRALRRRFPQVRWDVAVKPEPMAAASDSDVDLVQIARERMLAEGWNLVICLTDFPLHVGPRPVTAHASVTHGVGLVSVPALGPVALDERVRDAVLRLVEGLLGESVDDSDREDDRRRQERIRGRLQELASPSVGRAEAKEDNSVRFVRAVVRGNLRLLFGMVRANRPWRLIVGLSGAIAAALGVDIFGIASPGVWKIADGMSAWRLIVVCAASIVATWVALIVAHRLWEDLDSESARSNPSARERVVLFNLATSLTVAIGVLSLYLALLAINAVSAFVLIAPSVLQSQVGHPVHTGDYLGMAWVVTSLATLGGALGAALENHDAVQAAAYGRRPDERTEAERQQQAA
jgi:hypothetical protein